MRTTLRIAGLILILLALILPLSTYASGGPCPDDPVLSKTCKPDTPPWYVVVNRAEEHFDRPGSGCQPIILKHPECKDCYGAECNIDIEDEVCQYLPAAAGDILYVMCCECQSNPAGTWLYVRFQLDGNGGCDLMDDGWIGGLPPDTGIDLPVPFIVGGLAILGAGLLAAGVMVRRRSVRMA